LDITCGQVMGARVPGSHSKGLTAVAILPYMMTVHNGTITIRDVSEFKSEFDCRRNPTILGKSEIWRIYRLVYIRFRLSFRCIELSFIICCCPSFAAEK